MLEIQFIVNGKTAIGELYDDEVPLTCKAVLELLPLKMDLHYAKIAGQEVFSMIPLIMPVEKFSNVTDLKPGSIAYYPGNQMFCVFYGKAQPEECGVTVFSELKASEEFKAELDKVWECQGTQMIILQPGSDKKEEKYKHLIGEKWKDLWERAPQDLIELLKKRGFSEPVGPVIFAAGDLRKISSVVWTFREHLSETGDFDFQIFNRIISSGSRIIGGWYGLKNIEDAFQEYLRMIDKKPEDIKVIIDDMVLFAGRVALWADSLIPWRYFNDIMIEKKDWIAPENRISLSINRDK